MNFLLRLFVLIAPFLSYSQVVNPQQVTNIEMGPVDADILKSLRGNGLKNIFLGESDGLKAGERSKQIATFKDGYQAGFGMNEGLLLSTGDALLDLTHMNSLANASRNPVGLTTYPDDDLIQIYEETIYDAVVYKFKVTLEDFTTAIRVEFQFGSEEYPDYVSSRYNDSFGFFIRPVGNSQLPNGDTVINIARLPYSNNSISVNSVNGGYAGEYGRPNLNGVDYDQTMHYINNGHTVLLSEGTEQTVNNLTHNNGVKSVFIEYNGITKLITYDLKGLTPGGTYEFKIAIADASDANFDSGVIIKKIHGTTGSDLKIIKEIDNESPLLGDVVEFTLNASNLGPYDATGTVVNDLLPSGYTYVSHDASDGTSYDPITGVWNIGYLKAIHKTETLKVRARVENQGIYKNIAVIKSNDPDPDLSNNLDWVEPNPICLEERIFIDDFGFSDIYSNSGRSMSTYVPSNSFLFGTSAQNSSNDEEYKIGNGYYAVVAPAYIKDGWDQTNFTDYNWTPSVWEAGVMTDLSGEVYGAALAVNNKDQSNVFYKRQATIVEDKIYRLSFWTYLLENSSKFSLNIRDRQSGKVIATFSSDDLNNSVVPADKWTNISFHFIVPPTSECNVDDVFIELSNDLSINEESRMLIDNIEMTKFAKECYIPADIRFIDCSSKKPLLIINPVLINQAKN